MATFDRVYYLPHGDWGEVVLARAHVDAELYAIEKIDELLRKLEYM